jgi:hypothetical protein
MDNPETLTTMCKKYPDRRQAKKKHTIIISLDEYTVYIMFWIYRGFLPTNDTSKLELTFCCREDPNSTLSQTLPLTYPFILLKVPIWKNRRDNQIWTIRDTDNNVQKIPRPKTSKEKTHDYSKFWWIYYI